MKKEWKNIEGRLARIDVGSSLSEAMGSTFPAEAICFTTDGNIVFNGIQYSLSQDEYNAIMATIATKVDKKEGHDLASQEQLYAAKWCIEHILMDDDSSTSFLYVKEDGKNGYKFAHLVDGETYNSTPQYVPLATDSTSGIMSASDHADLTTAKEDIDTLFAAAEKTDGNVATNAANIAANAAAVKTAQSTADSGLSLATTNASEITRRAATMVLPISGVNALVSSAEAQGIDGGGAALGSLPAFATKLGGFVITKNLKTYRAWSGFSDIPNADSYGSTRTLYYDGTTIYRYDGSTLTDIFANHEARLAALTERVVALESTLAALTAESIIIE